MSRQKRLFCGLALFVLLISMTSPLVSAKEPMDTKDDYNFSLTTGIGDDDDDHVMVYLRSPLVIQFLSMFWSVCI